jgi:hypothetical protein
LGPGYRRFLPRIIVCLGLDADSLALACHAEFVELLVPFPQRWVASHLVAGAHIVYGLPRNGANVFTRIGSATRHPREDIGSFYAFNT